MNKSPKYCIGICGGSGSGKTYFLRHLEKALGKENVCKIMQDDHYKPRFKQIKDSLGYLNFDVFTALNQNLLFDNFCNLYKGKTIKIEKCFYNNKESKTVVIHEKPKPILLVEGILIFNFKPIFEKIDLKVFIDLDARTRLKQRTLRDQAERGYSLKEINYRFEHHAQPIYKKYVLPHKKDAHFIVRNDGHIEEDLNKIVSYIKNIELLKFS